jgi:hypothetical protein
MYAAATVLRYAPAGLTPEKNPEEKKNERLALQSFKVNTLSCL